MADDEPQPDLNAVVIERTIGEGGKLDLSIGVTGDVRPTEIGDVLANALRLHRARLRVE